MWGALSSFTQKVKSTAGALLDELVLEEDGFDPQEQIEGGRSEIEVYKTMLADVQHEQLTSSRKYQALFAEREEELQRWRQRAVALDASLADEAAKSATFVRDVAGAGDASDEDSGDDDSGDEEVDERPAAEVRACAALPCLHPHSLIPS